MEINYCRYLALGGQIKYESPKCRMLERVTLGFADSLCPLTNEYLTRVCANNEVAGRVCAHFTALNNVGQTAEKLEKLIVDTKRLVEKSPS